MKRFLFALSLLLPQQLLSNEPMIDSLCSALSQSKTDTQKVKTLDLLAFHLRKTDPDKGLAYANEALEISNRINWKQGKAMAWSGLALNYYNRAEFTKAIGCHFKALEIYRGLGMEKAGAGVMTNLSTAYKGIAKYKEALQYSHKALEIYEKSSDHLKEAIVSQNIGTIFLEQKNYSRAIEYFSRSMQIYSNLNNLYGVAMTLGNIAIIESALNNNERALNFHKKALEINRQLNESYSVQKNLANIGLIQLKLKEYEPALINLKEALEISVHYDARESIAINSGNLGEAFYQMAVDYDAPYPEKTRKQLYDSAITHLETGVNLSREIDLNGPFIEFSHFLALVYQRKGDYLNAFRLLLEHSQIKDSIFSQKNQVEISNLEARRELDLEIKDNQILRSRIEINNLKEERENNQILTGIIGLILLSLVVAGLIGRMNIRLKTQRGTLSDIAYYQSHKVRGPVARILGLAQLFNLSDPQDPQNAILLSHIKDETEQLDDLIKDIVKKAAQ